MDKNFLFDNFLPEESDSPDRLLLQLTFGNLETLIKLFSEPLRIEQTRYPDDYKTRNVIGFLVGGTFLSD